MTSAPRSSFLSRRSVLLGAAAAATAGTLGFHDAVRPTPVFAAGTRPDLKPVSMAMHLHSSFSEGIATYDAHLFQAREMGLDVCWWTDHDFRQMAAGYRKAVRFDSRVEKENNRDWTWSVAQNTGVVNGSYTFVTEPRSPREDGKAMRLAATAAGDAAGRYTMLGTAWNSTYSTSYSDTTLEIDVLIEQGSDTAVPFIEILSSYRPATGGRAAGSYVLQYRFGGRQGHWTENGGLTGVIGLPARVGQWQQLALRPVEDHRILWPDTVAEDASLWRLRFGLGVEQGASATAYFDRLRFVRERQTPADGVRLLQQISDTYKVRYPDVTQYPAAEISLVEHMNAFGGDDALPDYGAQAPGKDGSLEAQLKMVDWLHGHGRLVCLNHPWSNKLAEQLVATNGMGADMIEVGIGYANMLKVIGAFDTAARNGVFITANGVTDDHNGTNWMREGTRWITYAWSTGTERDAVLKASDEGQLWFVDPLHYRGEMQISVQGRPRMGAVHVTPAQSVPVHLTATELPSDALVDIIIGEVDRPGLADLTPAITTTTVPASAFVNGTYKFQMNRKGGRYVRFVVRHGVTGAIIGFANPVWVLGEGATGVPESRLVLS